MQSMQGRTFRRSSLSHRSLDVPRRVSFDTRHSKRRELYQTRLSIRAVAEPSVIDSTIDKSIETLKVLNATVPPVSEIIQSVTPVAKKVTESAVDVTSRAITAATPVVKVLSMKFSISLCCGQSAVDAAKDALTDQGVDVTDVQSMASSAVKTASDVATPAVKSSVTFLTTTDPMMLGYYALGALGLYFFGPSLFSFVIGSTRGYAGDISPAGALDLVLSTRNAYLIDIRTTVEKERSGVVDLPGAAGRRLIELEFATTKDRKLRGQLRDPESVECRITALQIAALKQLRRGSNVFLMDINGSLSKRVARELARLGFGRCFVVNGGYSGWIKAKLQTKPSATVSSAEVIQPSKIFSGTIQRSIPMNSQKSLPPGK